MSEINHSERKHALLSASGASRWLNCTPSPRLEERFPNKSSIFAEEGTLAHEFSDAKLRYKLFEINTKEYLELIKEIEKNPLYSLDLANDAMKYVEYVLDSIESQKQKYSDVVVSIEKTVDFSNYVKEGFGTNDCIIISDEEMHVIDLKFGKGVKVSAEENSQLKLYALGALNEYDLMYNIKKVRMTIHQPRLDNVSSYVLSVEQLRYWAETVVKPKAEMAFNGEGEQVAGNWCRFCRAKPVCKAIKDYNLELTKMEFSEPGLLSDDELIDVYKKLPVLIDWAKSVEEYLTNAAIKGKKIKEYKVVRGKSNRKEESKKEQPTVWGLRPMSA